MRRLVAEEKIPVRDKPPTFSKEGNLMKECKQHYQTVKEHKNIITYLRGPKVCENTFSTFYTRTEDSSLPPKMVFNSIYFGTPSRKKKLLSPPAKKIFKKIACMFPASKQISNRTNYGESTIMD